MSVFLIIGIAAGLAMDAFAVSIASGISIARVTHRHVFRLAFHFGLFQALMPILGWLAGGSFADYIESWDHWVAFGLLSAIGAKMAFDGIKNASHGLSFDPSRGWMLVSLSVATSIDALAVGLSFAMLKVDIWMPSVVIGLVAGIASMLGVIYGARIGNRWRRSAVICGGCVLLLIGAKILISHVA